MDVYLGVMISEFLYITFKGIVKENHYTGLLKIKKANLIWKRFQLFRVPYTIVVDRKIVGNTVKVCIEFKKYINK